MCRYGCILTAEEAFIFRIMPREDKSSKSWPIRGFNLSMTDNVRQQIAKHRFAKKRAHQ
jgi:hypothetical protein